MKKKFSVADMVYVAMMTAVMGILSQVALQFPTGVPMTLQTFAIALVAATIGWKRGTASIVLYILLGLVGVPVFAGAQAGPAVIAGPAGGFIWGFIPMVILCGIGSAMCVKGAKTVKYIIGYVLGFAGLALCHICGMIQFMILASKSFGQAFLLVSVPYLLKDVISVILAYIIGGIIRGRLKKANLI